MDLEDWGSKSGERNLLAGSSVEWQNAPQMSQPTHGAATNMDVL